MKTFTISNNDSRPKRKCIECSYYPKECDHYNGNRILKDKGGNFVSQLNPHQIHCCDDFKNK